MSMLSRSDAIADEGPASYRSLFENAVEGIYRTTPDGHYLAANPALARIYGYDTPDQLIAELTDIAGSLYVDPADRDRFQQLLAESDTISGFEAQVRRRDGSIIWIAENARVIRGLDGRVRWYEGTVQDVTARHEAEEGLRLAATVFDTAAEAILVCDAERTVHAANPAFEAMTGWRRAEVVGKSYELLATEMNDDAVIDEMWRVAGMGRSWQGEVVARRRDGQYFPAALSLTGVGGEDARSNTFVALWRDVTRQKMDEQRILHQARYDTLTRLTNRSTLMASLDEAIARAAVENRQAMVLFLDLNRFKEVNDSFGHAAGDEMLRQVANRIKSCTRLSDLVGRLGGDEFVIVLPAVAGREVAGPIIEKLLYMFSEPMQVVGREVYAGLTIGVSVFPEDGTTAEALLTNADAAMYHARSIGRSWCFFDAEMARQASDRLTLEGDLRVALARGEFRLHYQPKVDARTGQIVGAEALIRWTHPERGPVSPALFIPLAERAGLIGAIGEWTLFEATRAMRRWTDMGCAPDSVSVNLSPAQFRDSKLPTTVAAALVNSNIPADKLDLEITETMMAADVDLAVRMLTELRAMGVSLSIDDFGTGYSSLSYLKSFPIDTLKIDRAFVRDLPDNRKDAAIISSIVALADNLGFSVLAEGVETPEQAAILVERGCWAMQGFLYSQAVPEDQFAALMKAGPLTSSSRSTKGLPG